MLLQAKNIEKTFGGNIIFQNVDLKINEGEHIGLIGPNGAGKSTLLRILIRELLPDEGEIHLSKKARVGYLAQNSGLQSEKTVWDELLLPFQELIGMEKQLRLLETEMGKEEVYTRPDIYEKTLEKYSSLQSAFEEKGGYAYEAKIRRALTGLGMGGIDWKATPVQSLSGGQKTRVALAKLLLEEPDLLILDEPTNYLDMDAMSWLEQMLANYPGALLLVSHDRYFLDRLVTIIYELEHHQITRYVGNYSSYVKQKEARWEQQQKLYEKQQAEIKRMEEFIERNIARASTTKRAQSRRKALEKMERIQPPSPRPRKAAIRFEPAVRSGKEILEVKNLTIGYEKPLIQNLDFRIERGEHIALIGPNGLGKSTLLKTIAGKLPPLSGTWKWGTQVEMDYYDQEQQELNPDLSVIDELWNDHPRLDQTTIRSALGQFLFYGDHVFKKVSSLSGGEKARLSLCKRMLNQANFLLMDEPTNHLDMPSKERLEQALEEFPGTLLFISHDRYFIRRLATRIWELTPDGIRDYQGNYDWYLEKKALEQFEDKTAPPAQGTSSAPSRTEADAYRKREKEKQRKQKQRRQKLERLEQEIEQLESKIEEIHAKLCDPEIYNDPSASAPLQQKLAKLEEKLEETTNEWADLADES
ncbi:ABC-F family ATP-binding cassette domain-containing protein [Thermoactinomyces vulgaris]|uniref:ABC-F family ATP-binding cassette domain-containing protein n=2 Tax=Thermoactinomycetaceae TaxID=186824 RepID=A0ABS0QK48_THEVU|nr:ABC transporter ATP-binding protein [Thermoactinomyces sp. AS95]MBA4552701.1 ABC-F family ATP-binding cassette domain-containing protein [Thermoactinomyces vulgaris]MBI0388074.1 ABC-F family ATP-binding cassette domain-containing protein [Thermoactinomyces sp. CICC 24227]MBA4597636.1 ABC-F family ATP-binding cassette domain-containing protein [Thermoactinomyces vulgaris]MBH8589612.1 ABC-F family ATP-binding cassette domain-containing protein [Thermoactinomyces vulgaris]